MIRGVEEVRTAPVPPDRAIIDLPPPIDVEATPALMAWVRAIKGVFGHDDDESSRGEAAM